MKNLILFVPFLLLFWSCEEIAPSVNVAPPGGGEPTDQLKQVLVEEFTGVRCVNCPAGSAELTILKSTYGDRLIPVSIHAGDTYAPPFPQSLDTLRTEEGDALAGYLGNPFFYPSAIINRTIKEGTSTLHVGRGDWAGMVLNELAKEQEMQIEISKVYDEDSHSLTATVKLVPLKNLTMGDLVLTVMLTEDHIFDLQDTPEGLKTDYDHKYVLRETLSSPLGDPINNDLLVGGDYSFEYSLDLQDKYVADNCKLIAFVSINATDKRVLQAESVSLTEG